MSLLGEIALYEAAGIALMVAALRVRVIWRQRPAIGWDPDCLCWRSARRIYKERRWR